MALIAWTDSLSVRVAEIDNQHRKLIDMLNELNEAMRQGKGRQVIGVILGEMVEYAGIHFQTEEKYFDKYEYPASAEHKKEHSDFVEKVSDFREKFAAEKLGLSIEVMSFLADWLQNHIKGSDQKYSGFFQSKGLS